MTQPPAVINSQYPHYVCKLTYALYGFKQFPWQWFHYFFSFIYNMILSLANQIVPCSSLIIPILSSFFSSMLKTYCSLPPLIHYSNILLVFCRVNSLWITLAFFITFLASRCFPKPLVFCYAGKNILNSWKKKLTYLTPNLLSL